MFIPLPIHGGNRKKRYLGIKTDATLVQIKPGRDLLVAVASWKPKFVDEDGVDPEYIENEKKISH